MVTGREDRVFLDANILFAVAYRERSGLKGQLRRSSHLLMTSGYALEEALRNLDSEAQHKRLEELLQTVAIVPEASNVPGLDAGNLPGKDIPILAAAIRAGATHLITGDLHHFGHLFGTEVGRVLVLRPATYLRS